jgi:hypothetical protein
MPQTVSILAVGSVQLPTGLGTSRRMVSITYSVDGSMPRIVYIDADKDTPEERRRVVAEDWAQAQSHTPETLEIP